MPTKVLTRNAMESFQGWAEKFAVLAQTDTGGSGLQPEQACTVVALLVGMVAVLVEGKVAPGVIQKTLRSIKPFARRRVEGADIIRPPYCGDLVIEDGDTTLTPAQREEFNHLEDQLHHYRRYLLPTEWAIRDLSSFPKVERTMVNLRAAFLRNVDRYNLVSMGEDPLDLGNDFGFAYAPN